MPSVTAFEAKTRFGELLDRVSRGEEIVITRHEKPVARIVPAGQGNEAEVRQAVGQLLELRKKMAKRKGFRPLTDREIREAVEDGRR